MRLLSDVQGEKIDEVFIGSCMTNIGHFRAAGKLLDATKASCRLVCGWRRQPVWTPRS
jgi:aconitate hydratase 2/2-methylisocitrate dehydratase